MYKGTWNRDHMDGKGTLTLKDGSIIEAKWEMGYKYGKAIITESNGN